MKLKFSLFKFTVGLVLLYYGLKILHILPSEVINYIEGLIGHLLGNIWGLILVIIGIMVLLGSIYSNSRPTMRYYRTRESIFENDDEETK